MEVPFLHAPVKRYSLGFHLWRAINHWWFISTCSAYVNSLASRRASWKYLMPIVALVTVSDDYLYGNLRFPWEGGFTNLSYLEWSLFVLGVMFVMIPTHILIGDLLVAAYMLVYSSFCLPLFPAAQQRIPHYLYVVTPVLLSMGIHSSVIIVFLVANACLGDGAYAYEATSFGLVFVVFAVASELVVATQSVELQQQRNAVETLLDNATDGFCIVDRSSGAVSTASPQLKLTFGVNELESRHIFDFVELGDAVKLSGLFDRPFDEHSKLQSSLVTCNRFQGSARSHSFDAMFSVYAISDECMHIFVRIMGEQREHVTVAGQMCSDAIVAARHEQIIGDEFQPHDELLANFERNIDRAASVVSFARSMPETTSSGLLFADFETDRVAGGAEDNEYMRLRLEDIARLGKREGWLLKPSEITMDPSVILGTGGFGCVRAGKLNGTAVAVKIPKETRQTADESKLMALANELRLLRHVRHPNIVIFFGACIEPNNNKILLVMERVFGVKLAIFIRQLRSGDETYIRYKLIMDIVSALRYLHSQHPQIVHGDLKADNMLVVPALPQARLLDFGLSRMLTRSAKSLGGTSSWMAPEIIRYPDAAPKASSDVFSFGLLVYMITTSQRPFKGFSSVEIDSFALSGQSAPLNWPPDAVLRTESQRLCERVLEVEPLLRPSMAELHVEISSWPVLVPSAKAFIIDALRVRQEEPRNSLDYLEVGCNLGNSGREAEGIASGRKHPPAHAKGVLAAVPEDEELIATSVHDHGTRLSIPDLVETTLAAKQIMVGEMLMHWNVVVPYEACCAWHATLAALGDVTRSLQHRACVVSLKPLCSWQCQACGYTDGPDDERNDVCDICGMAASNSSSRSTSRKSKRGAHQMITRISL